MCTLLAGASSGLPLYLHLFFVDMVLNSVAEYHVPTLIELTTERSADDGNFPVLTDVCALAAVAVRGPRSSYCHSLPCAPPRYCFLGTDSWERYSRLRSL